MEVLNGVVSKTIPSCKLNNTHIGKLSTIDSKTHFAFSNVCFKGNNGFVRSNDLRNLVVKVVNCGYENKGHLEYYGDDKNNKGKKGWNEVSTKKKMKLLKGLSKDLSTFSELGFGLSFDCDEVEKSLAGDDNKSLMISQAAEVLLAQLKQLKSDEEKQRKKEKEDKKKCKNGKCDSSSSESESSDSECDEVVDMENLRNVSVVKPIKTKETYLDNDVQLSTKSCLPALKESKNDHVSLNSDQECSNMILETTLNKDASIEVLSSISSNVVKKIEVCMGGKCKKAGAPTLIEEFQKVVGYEGEVVGCKCMGKCKSGPNVKIVSNGVDIENLGDDSMRVPGNPLYIGVGLEDVELIVSSYLGEEMKGLGSSITGFAS